MRSTFNHSGAAGDLIYALPTIRSLGGGEVFLWPRSGPWITASMAEALRPLLLAQDYIDAVWYKNEHGIHNLDLWRHRYRQGLSIAEMVLRAFGLDASVVKEPWLTAPEPRRVAEVVIHRSPRYHAPFFPWDKVLKKYNGKIVMVGLHFEHKAFCDKYGHVPYLETKDYLELANVIAGSHLFIGNQSSPYAVAEGLKHNTLQEVCQYTANCLFDRPNAGYGLDDRLFLPEV